MIREHIARWLSKRNTVWLLLIFIAAGFLAIQDQARRGPATAPVQYEMVRLKTDPRCDISATPCSSGQEGFRIQTQLAGTASALTPFPVQVEIQSAAPVTVDKAVLEFTMVGMDMGSNRFPLKPDTTGKIWHADTVLPICSTGRRDWLLSVEIFAGERVYSAKYNFSLK